MPLSFALGSSRRQRKQEVKRAVEQARFLKEAGLSRPSLLARGVKALRNLLKARGESVQDHEPLSVSLIYPSEKTECAS